LGKLKLEIKGTEAMGFDPTSSRSSRELVLQTYSEGNGLGEASDVRVDWVTFNDSELDFQLVFWLWEQLQWQR
jgi:hypothetical protein